MDPGGREPQYEVIERRVLAEGLAPVKPWRAGRAASLVGAVSLGAAATVLALIGVSAVKPVNLAAAAVFALFAGAAFWAAVRVSTPAASPPAWAMRVLAAAPLVVLALAAFLRAGGLHFAPSAAGGVPCFAAGAAAALPPLFAALWVLRGGSPIAAWIAGGSAGAGAGLMATAMLHLHCPVGEISHVVIFHGGVVALAVLGAAALNLSFWRSRGRA